MDVDFKVLEKRIEEREEEMASKNLYEELCKKQKDGTLFLFDEITKEQLQQIWFYEEIPDQYIAELFCVSKYAVSQKRRSFNLTIQSCILNGICEINPTAAAVLANQ